MPHSPLPPNQPTSGGKDLIESSKVPDLERLAMQEMLNAMTACGELSGPPLKADGHDSETYQLRLREREARQTILDTHISRGRPRDRTTLTEARLADQRALDTARHELGHIPDGSYQGHVPKAACVKRVRELEAAYVAKWERAGEPAATILERLASPPAPGSLLRPEGLFDYDALERHLACLREAEAILKDVDADDPDRPEAARSVPAYRAAVVAALTPGADDPRATVPAHPRSPSKALPPLPPRPVVVEKVPLPEEPTSPEELEFLAWCREVDALPDDRRRTLMDELEAGGADLDDRRIGHLASSLVLERPAALDVPLADRLDERGLKMMALAAEEGGLAAMAPRLRMAIVKQLAARGGARAEARGHLAGALAVALVRQHPRALAELLEHTTGENKGPSIQAMARGLRDEELAAFGREALHAIYKALGGLNTDEARRQAARVVRLANRK